MTVVKKLKVFIKRALPEVVVSYVLRLKWEKMRTIDLSKIELIRSKKIDYLSDEKILENELLPQLGLNNELLYQLPEELYPNTGKGLHYWQYPNQFSKYLVLLSKLKIESYMEIGIRHGGTFILTVEYLQRFHHVDRAVGVELGYAPSVVAYRKINKIARFFQADSQTERFADMVKKEKEFDLVLIDGNHEEAECKNDFRNVKDIAEIIVLHDIVSVICPGVQKLWQEIKSMQEFVHYEFTDQYESVTIKTNQQFFGIGVAIKKSYLMKKRIEL